MKKLSIIVFCLFLTSLTPLLSLSQTDTCPTIAEEALSLTTIVCEHIGHNQVCYGNGQAEIDPAPNSDTLIFEEPGDMADLMMVSNLRLHPMNVNTGDWGVALMNLQANLPGTMPGQGVIFTLFGNVEMMNPTANLMTIDIVSTGNINVRSGPSTNETVKSTLSAGQTIVADGRNDAGDWLRIRLDDGGYGWVYTPLMTIEDDISQLDILDASHSQQAYYFNTGIGDAPCQQAPNSGILVRTPEGVGEISLTLNEVQINLGSTVFMQAAANADMQISVIEGKARVVAFETEQEARSNMRIRIPLDENLSASGPPSPPEACNMNDLQNLPVDHGIDCENIWVNLDNGCPVTVPYGMTIHISNGFGYHTRAEAEADYAPHVASIIVDGETVVDTVGPIEDRGNWYVYDMSYHWQNPEPGVHIVTGPGPHGSHTGRGVRTCEITVLEPHR